MTGIRLKLCLLLITAAVGLFSVPVEGKEHHCSVHYTKKSKLEGEIVHLKAIHPQDVPTLTLVKKNKDQHDVETWWTYNITEEKYQFMTVIRPAKPPVKIEDIAEMDREDEYHYFVTLNTVYGKPAMESSLIPLKPTTKDFHLTKQEGKLAKAVIVLETQKPNEELGLGLEAAIKQFVFADKFGNMVSYYITNELGERRYCVLFAMVDNGYAKAFIAGFHPKGDSQDDGAMHHLQTIPLFQLPLLTAVQLTYLKQPMVIIADANDQPYDTSESKEVILNVIKVYVHENARDTLLVKKQEILVYCIVSIDSIETHDGHIFLVVASKTTVLIYKLDKKTYEFYLVHEIKIFNVLQVKFQQLHSKRLLLNILDSEYENNILVYSLHGDNHWTESCKLTSPGAKFVEVHSFDYKYHKKDQLISVIQNIDGNINADLSYYPEAVIYDIHDAEKHY